MAKSLQQIKQELTAFEEKTNELAIELNRLYRDYLEALSQSIKQQLILAGYQVCTQIYPEEFLKLSFSQREKLQHNLRQLGQGIQAQLLSYLKPHSQVTQATITEQIMFQLSRSEEPSFQIDNSEVEPESGVLEIRNPEELVNWCKTIEQGINDTLDRLSQEANNHLQQSKIIPSNLPPQLLEMALKAEEGGLAAGGTPNVLNLVVETNREKKEVETEEDDDDHEPQITKISAIHLRLSEIVFADATLSMERKAIRNLLEKLKKIRHSYRKTQREYSKAEAETAWRSSWHD